jgi:uncharacterized Zn finger protein (UPF0148 family)
MSNFENVTMLNSCPQCHRLIEFDSYFSRYYCTSCDWRSEKICNNKEDQEEHLMQKIKELSRENMLMRKNVEIIQEENEKLKQKLITIGYDD